MYCSVKTTIDLPDDILVKAKIVAAERRTTLRELVVRGLVLVTGTPADDDLKKRKVALKRLLGEMRASNSEPMVAIKREDLYER